MELKILRSAIPGLSDAQYAAFAAYGDLLLAWNSRMNLTAITDPVQVAQKHFADSLLPAAFLPQGARVIDVGTGAGFPGVPLRILRPDIKLTLLDSLQKRIGFLQALCEALALSDVRFLHARAEDGARRQDLRNRFDIALSRAVAPCPVLLELTVPFLRLGGQSLMYKGPQAADELAQAKRALSLLHCEARLADYTAPWGERRVIVATKKGETPKEYPRKAGTPAKSLL
ncbi:MAG: 16S rRNA (guanine(527)-N(7))-methyltransferase RsmG [Candidatus Pelethousia sp.]|nr:16S rRNA (guanine(527)-N(7))-methyltransferase RsmG [Candidatus Pelethousia sp.]